MRAMLEVQTTELFDRWFSSLRDVRARARIDIRIRRLRQGNPGDVKTVGGGVFELRLTYGPGYRVYYIGRGEELVILLAGGDKSSQPKDIEVAKSLAKDLEGQDE